MPQKAPKPVPEGMHTVTPYLTFSGNCAEALEFYTKAFNAHMNGEALKTPDNKIMHAWLTIGDSNLFLSDNFGEDATVGEALHLWMYVEDADKIFHQAIQAGCAEVMPIEDAFWGDRLGAVKDPYGFTWSIASAKWEPTAEEMNAAEEEWLKSVAAQ